MDTIFRNLDEYGQYSVYEKVGAVILTNAKQAYTIDYRVSDGPPEPLSINNNVPKSNENVKIRKNFPETWIFNSFQLDSSATKEITKIVPDTITSWIITGFSIDSEYGLGLTKQPSKLNVFLPFFVTVNLPYSVKRGEVVSIPIIVYNYLESDQTAVVTLFNNNQEFEFVDAEDTNERSKREVPTEKKKEIVIKSYEGASIPFIIRPLRSGFITIKITAVAQMAGDGLERQLKVEPEGVTQYFNEAVLVGLVKGKEFSKEFDIVIPQEAVPDSTKIEVSVFGDVMGATIENLDQLIKLPTGCGEQNMLKFVPNILALDYLTSINKRTPKIYEKAKKYIESGYQNELKYKHDDGSYSAFGKSDKSGSTWLTAFVAKTYDQASKYIDIDEKEIYEALSFLKNIQAADGSFPEVGTVIHHDIQGGLSKGVALTAYTLVTLLEVKQHRNKFKGTIQKAMDYLAQNLDQIEDNYSLAIVSYALQLAQHPVKDEILEKLKRRSVNANGLRHWKKDGDDSGIYPNSISTEMSAYAMLAFLEGNQIKEAIPIMKWLVTQRNKNGGFQSTQDTVVGLQALAQFAVKIYTANIDMKIFVKPENSSLIRFHINSDNSLVLHKHPLPSDARHFKITAVGVGFSILQISYKYNLLEAEKQPRFSLKPEVSSKSNKKFLNLNVCTKFVPEPKVERSNMAIMEVTLPSGFAFETGNTNELLKTEKVKRVETKHADTVMMVYFDDIDSNEVCPEFKAFRIHSVAKQKPASVVIYDYYDNSRRAHASYSPPEISFCDICEDDDDCLDACESPVVYPN
ncbi:thioester-containing protein 1 allele R1-like [Chironomus tepperi]|uniref:thioester-containing protein 1 allele R1-like n=1 Tax=Chironomus tepperi TaxID=113505 RepID=UPI00391F6D54